MEIQCKGCDSRYRVKLDMAGRMVRCKNCGVKFRVPYQARVTTLESEDSVENAQPQPQAPQASPEQRTFEEYGAKPLTPLRKKRYEQPEPPLIPLPQEVAELWLPLGVSLLTYGISAYILIRNIAALPSPLSGFIILTFLVLVFLSVVFPMVMRTLEGASSTFEFDLPNSVKLQTTAALGMPVLGISIGLFAGGFAGLLAGCAAGLALMLILMLFMYQAPGLKGVQAGLLASVFFALWSGGGALAVFGLAWVLLPSWNLFMPWQEPPKPQTVAAAAASAAAANSNPSPQPPTLAAAKLEPPTSVEPATLVSSEKANSPTTAPAPTSIALVEEPKWIPVIDPVAPARLPTNISHTFNMTGSGSVTTAGSDSHCIALVDADSCDIYDLRGGRRISSLKESLLPSPVHLSPSGKYLLARPSGRSSGAADRANSAMPRSYSQTALWSTSDGRLISQLDPAGLSNIRFIGFAGEDTLVSSANSASHSMFQVWDARSGQVLKTFDGDPGLATAISPCGKFLAAIHDSKLKFYDLAKGAFLQELPLTPPVRLSYGLRFNSSGTMLALVVGEMPQTLRLLVVDLASGKVANDWPLTGSPTRESQSDLFWSPAGDVILYGGALIDRATGKVFCRLTAQAQNGAIGRLRGMLSTYHMLYEFVVPAVNSSSRVIYKSVMLNKADVDNALLSIRGTAYKPEEVAAAPTTTPEAARPVSLAAVAAQKDWTFTVMVVRKADVAAIEHELQEERSRLPDLERKVVQTKEYSDRVSSAQQITGYDRNKKPMYRKTYSEREIGDAAVAASRAADEKKKANAKILRLEREKKEAAIRRTVAGKLDDGTPIEIEVEGAAMTAIADGCEPDARWRVTGGGRVEAGTLRVRPRTLASVP